VPEFPLLTLQGVRLTYAFLSFYWRTSFSSSSDFLGVAKTRREQNLIDCRSAADIKAPFLEDGVFCFKEGLMRALHLPPANRILIVMGHYGSGKTEFSVSLAMRLARDKPGERLAVIDMDIANPYFRSRERRGTLETAGIEVFGSLYDKEITAELPALGARLRAPLENKSYRVIVDAGGNDSGALVLNQFKKYFTPEDATALAVVNFSRYETQDAETAIAHIDAIEYATGLRVEYLVNNTHLLRETTAATVAKGHRLAAEVCERTGKKLFCDCYPAPVVKEEELVGVGENPFPLGLYMRPTWLDR
jgi:hypothetical protein